MGKSFEQHMKERFAHYAPTPPEGAWEKIRADLKPRTIKPHWIIAAATAALLLLSLFIYIPKPKKEIIPAKDITQSPPNKATDYINKDKSKTKSDKTNIAEQKEIVTHKKQVVENNNIAENGSTAVPPLKKSSGRFPATNRFSGH